jgi:hypothetical protein
MFGLEYQLEKLRRFCDVNFDMKDIATSCDIIEEWKEISPEENFNDRVFKGQDNNDGQLYIDITNYGIKYCFTKYCADGEPMDAEQYMEWDYQDSKYLNWRIPCEYMSQETIDYTEENIKIIKDMATLMTKEELAAFINDDYSYLYTS